MSPSWKIVEGVGSSMDPCILPGDRIVCDTTAHSWRPGDVLLFRDVVHRVVWIDPAGGVWECGDRPDCRPRRRARSEVQGRAMFLVRDSSWHEIISTAPSATRVARLVARRVRSRAGSLVRALRKLVVD